ncbi:hypothetical protein ACSQ6I_02460 [Anabaena sp. WFMT]|uniref:hypothetical protein n=1 Tax=Anabaena sp. WFMT TaxID=3449730 RepID=UPI003F261E9B
MDFFDRLYLGFEAEYYIMGRLFGAGYEAFKMPADFGFDILVTNQKEQSLPSKTKQRDVQPPYALQVKSRRIKEEDFQNVQNGRPELIVAFTITSKNLDLMLSHDNAYLICVIFVTDLSGIITNKVIHFWLSKSHLQDIKSLGGFRKQPDKQDIYELKSRIRLRPTTNTDSFLQEKLVDKGYLNKQGKEILLEELPKNLPRNWNATEYISISRPPLNDRNSNSDTFKRIPSELTDFKNLGMKIEIIWRE